MPLTTVNRVKLSRGAPSSMNRPGMIKARMALISRKIALGARAWHEYRLVWAKARQTILEIAVT